MTPPPRRRSCRREPALRILLLFSAVLALVFSEHFHGVFHHPGDGRGGAEAYLWFRSADRAAEAFRAAEAAEEAFLHDIGGDFCPVCSGVLTAELPASSVSAPPVPAARRQPPLPELPFASGDALRRRARGPPRAC